MRTAPWQTVPLVQVPAVRSFYYVHTCLQSCRLFATPWTAPCQAPLFLGFSRQEYWSGLPCLSPGDLPDPGAGLGSPTLQADSLPSELPGKPLGSNLIGSVLKRLKYIVII